MNLTYRQQSLKVIPSLFRKALLCHFDARRSHRPIQANRHFACGYRFSICLSTSTTISRSVEALLTSE